MRRAAVATKVVRRLLYAGVDPFASYNVSRPYLQRAPIEAWLGGVGKAADVLRNPRVKQVASGGGHSLIAYETDEGRQTIIAGGHNAVGQLSLGFNNPGESTRGVVEGFEGEDIVSINANLLGTYILVRNGESNKLFVAGTRTRGQLGVSPKVEDADAVFSRATELEHDESIEQIAVGYEHALALTSSGKLLSTGANPDGQLGLGDDDDRYKLTPIDTSGIDRISSVYAGADTSAIIADRQLLTFGNSEYGQAMHGRVVDKVLRPLPVDTLQGRRIVDWQCGGSFSVALDGTSASDLQRVTKRCRGHMTLHSARSLINLPATTLIFGCSMQLDEGQLWIAGFGSLGLGHERLTAIEPVPLQLDGRVTTMTAVYGYVVFATDDGRLFAHGVNSKDGRLGLGPYDRITHVFAPQALDLTAADLTSPRVLSIAAGRETLWVLVEGEEL